MKLNLKPLSPNKRLVFEFVSITFAVFLALMVNQWRDHNKNNKLARQSIDHIRIEITDNVTIIQKMITSHKQLLHLADSLMPLADNPDMNGDTLVSIDFKLLNSTAWQTAKLTQAITFMEMDIVNEVSGLYQFQNYYEDIVKDYVLKNIFSRPKERDKEFLDKIQILLSSIIPIEENLAEIYNHVLKNVLTI